MEALSSIFQSFPRLALYYTTVVRFVFVVLAVFIVGRAVISLLRAKTPPEIWGYLSLPGSHFVPILTGRTSSAATRALTCTLTS